jgi:hypothetical protein
MFVGHTALALAAKRRAPEISLGWLLAASILLDLVSPVLLFLGFEKVSIGSTEPSFVRMTFLEYPWSHSLAVALGYGALVFALARWRRVSAASALLLGALVVSHWALDAISHVPDMPLWPGEGPKVGLGLWTSIPLTFAVEGTLFLAGIWIYLGTTKAKDKIGMFALWGLLLIQTLMWATSPWGAAPPSLTALAAMIFIVELLFLVWASWADRHRDSSGLRR